MFYCDSCPARHDGTRTGHKCPVCGGVCEYRRESSEPLGEEYDPAVWPALIVVAAIAATVAGFALLS